MSKLSLMLCVCVLWCAVPPSFANNFLYYPNSAALNYPQYPAFPPYMYAWPVDCDKSSTPEGGETSTSSESSSSEESASTEGDSSSESSSEETKESGESESSSSSSEEEGGKKEEGEGKKEDSKKKVVSYVFPPVTSYPYPQTGQQIIYSAPPSYAYMPYKAYSVVPQTANYKNSGYNNAAAYPYYSLSGIPNSYSARIVSSPVASPAVSSYPGVSKTITFGPASGVGGPAGYWNGNVGYYRV